MRSRLERMQEAYLDYIAAQEGKLLDRDETLNWERMHMASCARLGYLMAQERGVDPDLSACACAIHDIGRVVTGRQAGHAQAGLAPARAFLVGTGLFSPEEAELLPPEQAARPAIMVRDRAAAVNFFIMSCFFIVFSSKKQNLFGWAMEGPVPAALTWERSQ